MIVQKIGIFIFSILLAFVPYGYANDDINQDLMEDFSYEEEYDDIDDLIGEEFSEYEDFSTENSAVETRTVSDRLSCDEIATRIAELREDVKAYPELKADLESMLTRQRNQCASRAARRPVHNYRNVNPVVEVEIPEVEIPAIEDVAPQEVPVEDFVDDVSDVDRQAQIIENISKGLCVDGTKPNKYGCCPGEVFKQLEHLDFACCPKDGNGDCREPRKKL